ncbi:MAG: hypothetical protein WAM58_21670 [Candidatus Acidiferrum sp.]
MRASSLLGLSLCFVFTTAPAISQEISVGSVRTNIEGIEIPPVPNVPFTAKVVVTWNQPLVGGGIASRKYYTMVARDSQGRVRRETRVFVNANSGEDPPLRSFTIFDPVSGTRTICTKASMTCATSPFDVHAMLTENTGDNGNGKRENLGQQTMQGLPVTGTRETVSNASGTRVGLRRTDVWYSSDLHMALSVIRSDQQLGEVTLNVTNLVRGEPEAMWMEIPAGYRVMGASTP